MMLINIENRARALISKPLYWVTNHTRLLNRLFFFLCLTVVFFIVFTLFVRYPGFDSNPNYFLHDAVTGQAHKPFVYRALVPGLVRILVQIIPESIHSTIFANIPGYQTAFIKEFSALSFILMFFLSGFFLTLRELVKTYFSTSEIIVDWIALLGIMLLPVFFDYTNYIYDFATLMFFSLLLLLMARARWKSFFLVYIFACLNKETTILITMIFFLYFWQQKDQRRLPFVLMTGLQLLIFSVISLSIRWMFRNNPGATLEFHLFDHNFETLSIIATPANLLTAIGLFILMAYAWQEKPLLLRISLIALPALVGSCFFFGYLDELRAYYEALPAMLLLAVHTLSKILPLPISLRPVSP